MEIVFADRLVTKTRNLIALNLAIQRGELYPKQFCRAGLASSRSPKRVTNQGGFKSLHLIVEADAVALVSGLRGAQRFDLSQEGAGYFLQLLESLIQSCFRYRGGKLRCRDVVPAPGCCAAHVIPPEWDGDRYASGVPHNLGLVSVELTLVEFFAAVDRDSRTSPRGHYGQRFARYEMP